MSTSQPRVYYNEHDPQMAAWLRELMKVGAIPLGDIDERDIWDVLPADVAGYRQAHFFAGIGGWAEALRLAEWPEQWPIWTGSCPCQPHSSATRGRAIAEDLWEPFGGLITACRPPVVVGEQVAAAGAWIDDVCDDLEAVGYFTWAAILPACGVGFDHARPRIYFIGDTDRNSKSSVHLYAEASWVSGHRRIPGGVGTPNGFSATVGYRGFGNAIVPQVAAEFLKAYVDERRSRNRR